MPLGKLTLTQAKTAENHRHRKNRRAKNTWWASRHSTWSNHESASATVLQHRLGSTGNPKTPVPSAACAYASIRPAPGQAAGILPGRDASTPSRLDYWPYLNWSLYENWNDFLPKQQSGKHDFCSTKTTQNLYECTLRPVIGWCLETKVMACHRISMKNTLTSSS